MNQKLTKINMTLGIELKEKIKLLAKMNSLPVSTYCRYIIVQSMKKEEGGDINETN